MRPRFTPVVKSDHSCVGPLGAAKPSGPVISESYQELGYDLDAHEWVVGARLHVSFTLSSGTSGRRLAAPLGARAQSRCAPARCAGQEARGR
jgi:hypothetical protein